MGKTPNKKLVFVMDEHGRVLTKESLHNLISELLIKCSEIAELNLLLPVAQQSTFANILQTKYL